MKKRVNIMAGIVSLLAVGAALPLAADETSAQAYVNSYRGRTGIPLPVSVVTPAVDPSWAGEQAVVEFVVNASGEPTQVTVQSATSIDLGRSLRNAISEWRFKPLMANGVAVPVKVVLPVNVI